MKKITDKMRLDWCEVNLAIAANPTVGSWTLFPVWRGASVTRAMLRNAIDAAILKRKP